MSSYGLDTHIWGVSTQYRPNSLHNPSSFKTAGSCLLRRPSLEAEVQLTLAKQQQ